MTHLPPADAPTGESLQQQQHAIGEALDELAQERSRPELRQAQQASQQAEESLSRGRLPEAAEAMGQARRAMLAAAGERGAAEAPQENAPAAQKPDPNGGPPEQGGGPAHANGAEQAHPNAPQLAQLADRQAELQRQAEALASQPPPAADETREAARGLSAVHQELTELAADERGSLPPPAAEAVRDAQQSSTEAAAQASAQQAHRSANNARDARDALIRAQAMLALARQGMRPQQTAAQAQAQAQAQQRPAQERSFSRGQSVRRDIHGASSDLAASSAAPDASRGQYLGLPQRDRQAIRQSRQEKYPAEYAPMIEQYLKNLSDQPRPDEPPTH
jgi:hypothetical protein